MKTQTSTSYKVDNRYRGLEEAVDDRSGARFLQSYLERKRISDTNPQGQKKEMENKFILGGMGGTVPVSSINGNLGNTDARYAFKNLFRASQS